MASGEGKIVSRQCTKRNTNERYGRADVKGDLT